MRIDALGWILMSERAILSLEARSPIGRAIMLQVLSAIMIIGSIAAAPPTIHFSGIFSVVFVQIVVIVIGVFQMLITRAVLQKEHWGISAALISSLLALLFSVTVGTYWIIYQGLLGPYFIIVGIVNTILAVLLAEIRKTL
jgi:hypothetical protein